MLITRIFSQEQPPEGGVAKAISKEGRGVRLLLAFHASAPLANAARMAMHDVVAKAWKTHLADAGAQEGGAEAAFEAFVREANAEVMQHEGLAKGLAKEGGVFLGALFEGSASLFFTCLGSVDVFLLRNGKLENIAEGLSSPKPDQEPFHHVASGMLETGDRLALASAPLLRARTKSQLTAALGGNLAEAAAELHLEGAAMLVESESDAIAAAEGPNIAPKAGQHLLDVAHLSHLWHAAFRSATRAAHSLWRRFLRLSPRVRLAVGAAAAVAVLFAGCSALSSGPSARFSQFLQTVEGQFLAAEGHKLSGEVGAANAVLDSLEVGARELLASGANRADAAALLERIAIRRDDVNDVTRVSTPEVAADLRASAANIASRGMFFLENELFVFDASSLVRVFLVGGENEPVGDITADELVFAASFPENGRAALLTRSGGMLEWSRGNGVESVSTEDQTWRGAADMETYGKFLYFLDPRQSQIWRYERRTGGGYSSAEAWLAEPADLGQTISMAIDGAIFLLDTNGQIRKFYRGTPVDFRLEGLPNSQDRVTGDRIFTNQNLGRLFVLDRNNASVTIFRKEENRAVYERRVVFENVGPLQDMFFANSRLFVLGTSRVFEVGV